MKLDCSFVKLYQVVKVESGEPKKPFEYRLQENSNFTYEECFSEEFIKDPQWGFIENKTFGNSDEAVNHAFYLYDLQIIEKWKEYKEIKNNTVLEVLEWNDLEREVGFVVHKRGLRWPKPPVK